MNYRIFLTILIINIPFFSFEQISTMLKHKDGFMIECNISGLPDKSVVYLLHRNTETRKVDTADRAMSLNGLFYFKGKVDFAAKFYTILIDTSSYKFSKRIPNYLLLLLDNSNIIIRGNINTWPEIKLEGSSAATDYIEYLKIFSKLYSELQATNKVIIKKFEETNMLLDQFLKANQKTDVDKANITIDSLKSKFADAERLYNDTLVKYIQKSPNSYLTPFSILKVEQLLGAEGLNNEYEKLTPRVKSSLYGLQLKERINELSKINMVFAQENIGLEIGKIAPDFRAENLKNETILINEIVNSNKLTLLDFWASWCKPCRSAFPELKKIYEKYSDKGFTIISISTDKDLDSWKKATEVDKLPWYNISDVRNGKSFVEELYKISKLPTTYLLNSSGKIIKIDPDTEELKEALIEIVE